MDWNNIFSYYSYFNNQDEADFEPVTPSCSSPEDVRIYYSPWVANAHMTRVLGSHTVTIKRENLNIEDGLEELEKKFRANAFYLGANAVTSYSCDLHLWENPRVFIATGSSCVLRFMP